MTGWKVVGASVRGPDHEDSGLPCQDAFGYAAVDERIVAVVSDGAGSARFSDDGARVLCDTVVDRLADCDETLDGDGGAPSDRWRSEVEAAVDAARAEVATLAGARAASDPPARLADYHATLVGVVADPAGGFFFHIGDGTAAAIGKSDDWSGCTLSRPENGEFANETYFYTQEIWRDHLRFTSFTASELIVMMSDGAMPFTVADRFQGLETRFMAPVTAYLDGAAPEVGQRALAATLDRPDARRISRDDKTVLWARLLRTP